MKIPRDVSAGDLIKRLKVYEYEVTRQSGSHIRLTTKLNGEHHLTVPDHRAIKIGTLSSILNSVAEHFNLTKEVVAEKLFS